MFTSLTVDVHEGYQQAAEALNEEGHALVAAARGRRSRDGGRSLMAIVLAYREGPRKVWGPVLLELMAPSLLARLRRLRTEPPVMEAEDVRQQLVVELLLAAARMPLPQEPGYLRSRLMARANQGVRRRLRREARRQARQESFETSEDRRW
jgi:hypothetical protein